MRANTTKMNVAILVVVVVVTAAVAVVVVMPATCTCCRQFRVHSFSWRSSFIYFIHS